MKRLFTVLLLVSLFSAAYAEKVGLDASLAYPYMIAGESNLNYLRIGLNGFELETAAASRPPVNAAIVLDVSGSMSGEKLRQAVQAAHTAIDMLKNGDAVALVTYSDFASVLVPAAVLSGSNRLVFHNALDRVYSDGYTALFSGVSMGAAELDRYLSENRISRVVLLSDGLANVGPSTPGELASLGAILKKRGISVSTIGLGSDYNEDLMFQLAAASDGNHAFVEHPSDLVRIFEKEFETLLQVVARDLEITIAFADGIKPRNLLNRTGDIYGNEVHISLNQLYSGQEQYAIIECDTFAGLSGMNIKAADISVSFLNMVSGERETLTKRVELAFTNDSEKVASMRDKKTLGDVVLQTATATNIKAVELRDMGKIDEAEKLLLDNSLYLEQNAKNLDNEKLKQYAEQNKEDAQLLDEEDWLRQRKIMRDSQYENQTQQVY
ncbi:MAG: VWA domain-containing protein [Spirochaetales bacterium]|nr:VWA domain-containing protein [Spirochaetales bacterium]